jgi:hypothetical protein
VNGPPEVWIDRRVIGTMKTEPDLDKPEGVEQLLYISQERVAEITRAARGGDEFFIQIMLDQGALVGLTNYGRIFHHEGDAAAWFEIPVPELES